MVDYRIGLATTSKIGKTLLRVYMPIEDEGRLFCGFLDGVVPLEFLEDIDLCSGCPFFHGTAQGRGRECGWNKPVRTGRQFLTDNELKVLQLSD